MRGIINRILLVLVYIESTKADCFIERKNLVKESPIVLRQNYYTQTYLHEAIYLPAPNAQRIAIINKDSVYIACPGSRIWINNNPTENIEKLFNCNNGKFDNYFFSSITCEKIPKYDIKEEGNGFFRVGFQVSNTFLTHIEGRFDNNRFTTLYTSHILTNGIGGLKIITAHNSFVYPYFKKCGDCYKQVNQMTTISGLFKEKETKSKVKGYFESGRKYLAKGHLAPHDDFNFAYQQKATYPYFNCVPQWQQINNGNWLKLERDIRKLASRKQNNLEIYTGTVQISKFFEVNQFLHSIGSAKYIPVPKFIWKIVKDPSSGGAVAFVMSNNPYDKTESSSFRCTDVCKSVTHLINTSASNCSGSFQKGCLYCCKVDDMLRESIPHLPISSASLLN